MVAPSSQPTGRTTVESIEGRQLAESLHEGATAFAHQMFEFIAGEIEEVGSDPETVALTMASCVSTVETGLTMVRHGIPVERAEAPVAALEHARHMAARGISVDTTLRFYRLGHAFFWRWWIAALSEQIDDAKRLAAALAETATFSFAYVDAVSADVTAELLAERDRRERRITAMREDVVDEILSGAAVDSAAVQRTLGFSFDRPFLAFLCRGEGAPAALESAAAALVAALGAERPLLLAHGADALIGWVHVAVGERGDPIALARATGAAAPDVHVAVGSVASGEDGFRSSHDEAMRAQRVATLTRERAPSFTRFEDVALVDLLSADLTQRRPWCAESSARSRKTMNAARCCGTSCAHTWAPMAIRQPSPPRSGFIGTPSGSDSRDARSFAGVRCLTTAASCSRRCCSRMRSERASFRLPDVQPAHTEGQIGHRAGVRAHVHWRSE